MVRVREVAATIASILLAASGTEAQCQYEAEIIEGPSCGIYGNASGVVWGMNELGHVVGYYQCAAGTETAFVWTPDTGLTTLSFPVNEYFSEAYDINDSGQIVGGLLISGEGYRGFVLDRGKYIELPPPGASTLSWAYANNNLGQVAGYRGTPDAVYYHAFLWEDGVFTDIVPMVGPRSVAWDVNDSGEVVGRMGTAPELDSHAFLWEDGELIDLGVIPGGFTASAHGINNLGQVVGSGNLPYDGFGQLKHAFLWTDGEMIDLGTLPDLERCHAFDINDAGQIVGDCTTPNLQGQRRTFIWQDGVMSDLNELIPPELGLHVFYALAINNAGQIAGTATGPSGAVGVLLTPVCHPPGDLNLDCGVGILDLLALLGAWGRCPLGSDCLGDVDGDGNVGVLDLLVLLANWSF